MIVQQKPISVCFLCHNLICTHLVTYVDTLRMHCNHNNNNGDSVGYFIFTCMTHSNIFKILIYVTGIYFLYINVYCYFTFVF